MCENTCLQYQDLDHKYVLFFIKVAIVVSYACVTRKTCSYVFVKTKVFIEMRGIINFNIDEALTALLLMCPLFFLFQSSCNSSYCTNKPHFVLLLLSCFLKSRSHSLQYLLIEKMTFHQLFDFIYCFKMPFTICTSLSWNMVWF